MTNERGCRIGGRNSVQARDHNLESRANSLGNISEFDHIQSALTRLVLADERLRYIQPLGDIDLGESGFLAQLPQQRT